MRFSWINPGWKKRNFYGILCYQMSHPLHLFRPTFTTLLFEIRSFFHKGADAPIVCPTQMFQRYIAIFFKKIVPKEVHTYCIFRLTCDAVVIHMCGSKNVQNKKSSLYFLRRAIYHHHATWITYVSDILGNSYLLNEIVLMNLKKK